MRNMNKKTMYKYAKHKQVHGDMIQLLKTKQRSPKQNTDAQNTIHPGWSNAKHSGFLDACVEGDPHSPDLNVGRRWQLEVALIRGYQLISDLYQVITIKCFDVVHCIHTFWHEI